MNVGLYQPAVAARITDAHNEIQKRLAEGVTIGCAVLVESPDSPGMGVYEIWFATSDLHLAHITQEGQLVMVRDLDLEGLR